MIGLDCLEMTALRREAAREEIRKKAYFKWLNAGRPVCDPLKFWREAELDWIETEYVPDRPFEELSTEEVPLRALEPARTRELVAY